ncbi:hypothetical protein F5887DRAFT_965201 [Amanita rubescens]|nr:hypothetical protein F5887DRAFT_965201 [Amanita rubescens]
MHYLPALSIVVLLAVTYSEAKPGQYEPYAFHSTIPAQPKPKNGITHKLRGLLGYKKGPELVSCALRATPDLWCPVNGDCCPDDSCCPSGFECYKFEDRNWDCRRPTRVKLRRRPALVAN